jgi:hypothetical protein
MDNQPTKSKQPHKCIGMGDSGMTNLSERVDQLLFAEEKLVRGEIQDYTVKINQKD